MKKLFILAAMSIYLAASATLVCAETPDEIMKTAVQLYQNADYDLAAEQFKKYVGLFPAGTGTSPTPLMAWPNPISPGARCANRSKTFEKLLASYPASEKAPDAKLRLGDCHYILKEYEKAVEAYKAFLRALPR